MRPTSIRTKSVFLQIYLVCISLWFWFEWPQAFLHAVVWLRMYNVHKPCPNEQIFRESRSGCKTWCGCNCARRYNRLLQMRLCSLLAYWSYSNWFCFWNQQWLIMHSSSISLDLHIHKLTHPARLSWQLSNRDIVTLLTAMWKMMTMATKSQRPWSRLRCILMWCNVFMHALNCLHCPIASSQHGRPLDTWSIGFCAFARIVPSTTGHSCMVNETGVGVVAFVVLFACVLAVSSKHWAC